MGQERKRTPTPSEKSAKDVNFSLGTMVGQPSTTCVFSRTSTFPIARSRHGWGFKFRFRHGIPSNCFRREPAAGSKVVRSWSPIGSSDALSWTDAIAADISARQAARRACSAKARRFARTRRSASETASVLEQPFSATMIASASAAWRRHVGLHRVPVLGGLHAQPLLQRGFEITDARFVRRRTPRRESQH